jgi:hypothetical protein
MPVVVDLDRRVDAQRDDDLLAAALLSQQWR